MSEGKSYQCVSPGCSYATDVMEASVAVEFLKMHVSQVHGIASKPEKPKKPVLEMSGNTINSLEWDAFTHKFSVYKQLSGISKNAGSHFLDCLSKEVWRYESGPVVLVCLGDRFKTFHSCSCCLDVRYG